MSNRLEQLEQLLKQKGVLRVGDLETFGYPRSYLGELQKRGKAIKQTRGVYMHPDTDIPLHYSLALACKKVPDGVICLLSALSYHGIGTQNPHEVWMAIDRKARIPKVDFPPLRVVRFSGTARTEGVESSDGSFPIRIYNPAKTIADCFKYRNKFGLDIAIEALREGWRNRRFSIDELNHYTRICRVEKVITPYLEAIL